MTGWKRIAYSIACVVVPAAWGLLVVFISNCIDKKMKSDLASKSSQHGEDKSVQIEYHL